MNRNKAKARITMQELADIAGVTRGTVSRALSDSSRVNEKTKARIRALANKHNYQVNQRARNFRLQKTKISSITSLSACANAGLTLNNAATAAASRPLEIRPRIEIVIVIPPGRLLYPTWASIGRDQATTKYNRLPNSKVQSIVLPPKVL